MSGKMCAFWLVVGLLAQGCDAEVSGVCEAAAGPDAVYASTHNNVFPRAVWTGEAALLTWTQVPPDLGPGTVWLLPLDASGVPLADEPVAVAQEVVVSRSAVVWTGGAAVVLWVDRRGVEDCLTSRAYDASGAALGAAAQVHCMADLNGFPSVALDGTEIVAAWNYEEQEDERTAMVARLDSQGALSVGPVTYAVPDVGEAGLLVGAGADGAHMAWGGWNGIHLARIEADGTVTGDEVIVPAAEDLDERVELVALATDASALAWLQLDSSSDTSVLRAAPLGAADQSVALSHKEGFVALPSRLVAGDEGMRAVAWTDAPDAATTSVYLATLGANDALDMRAEIGPQDETIQAEPGIAAVPGGFLVAWRGTEAGVADRINVRSVGCTEE